MRRLLALARICAAALLCAACLACGGSSDDPAIAADFAPDAVAPSAGSVALQKQVAAADVVTVDLTVTDTADVFGVAFDLTFDPARTAFVEAAEGTFLDGDGVTTSFLVTTTPGRVVVGLTRLQDPGGNVTGLTAVGTVRLASFTFRTLRAGDDRLDFDAASPRSVTDEDGVPLVVSWSGGTLLAR